MRVQLLCLKSTIHIGICLIFGLSVALAQGRTSNDNSSPRITGGGSNNTIRGKIFLPSGNLPENRIRVTLELNTGGVAGEVFSDSVGNFEFRSIPNNNYKVIAYTDGSSFETTQESVEVSGSFGRTFNVQIYLREKNSNNNNTKPNGKMLSAAEYSQDVPKNARKLYERGLKQAKDGKDAEALTSFEEALKLYPDYLLALNKLGEQQAKQNNVAEAQATFERAIAINPKFPLTQINLGTLLFKVKRYPEAIEHLESAIRADQDYPVAHLYLGWALMENTPPDFTRAEQEMRQALALSDNKLTEIHLQLFNLYVRQQNFHMAAAALEAYLKANPDSPNATAVREKLALVKKAAASQPKPPELIKKK